MKHRDAKGDEIPDTGHISIGFCMADQFVPTAWDNAKVSDGVFISREAKDGYYYTRLEWHKWNGFSYYISNELFRSEIKSGSQIESQDILGFRYPLDEIYPFLNAETELQGLDTSLLPTTDRRLRTILMTIHLLGYLYMPMHFQH